MTEINKKNLEIYIHIPFCKRKCLYCDFLSFAGRESMIHSYLDALLTEIEGKSAGYKDCSVSTVFIGGGTPSILDSWDIKKIINSLKNNYNISDDCEITIEVNPGTVDKEKLEGFFGAGINRLSIGLQSASDAELKSLGRIHSLEDFVKTYNNAREAGFSNINVDVISALPNQSLSSYQKTLEFLMNLKPQPEHVSAYSLIIEEGTCFYDMYERGELLLPDEDEERRMYSFTKEFLEENGYHRYEISNYAKNGFNCKHNEGYWRRENYLGFGIGAASLIENVRFKNIDDLEEYIKAPLCANSDFDRLTPKDQEEEFMFLGLRMLEGVKQSKFEQLFGKDIYEVFGDVIERNIADGLLCEEAISGDKRFYLSDKGLDLSNYVFSQFLLD